MGFICDLSVGSKHFSFVSSLQAFAENQLQLEA